MDSKLKKKWIVIEILAIALTILGFNFYSNFFAEIRSTVNGHYLVAINLLLAFFITVIFYKITKRSSSPHLSELYKLKYFMGIFLGGLIAVLSIVLISLSMKVNKAYSKNDTEIIMTIAKKRSNRFAHYLTVENSKISRELIVDKSLWKKLSLNESVSVQIKRGVLKTIILTNISTLE